MRKFTIYTPAIGRPGTAIYRPRQDLGTGEAATAMRALDAIAARLGQTRLARTHSVPVLGVGSIRVEALDTETPTTREEV